MAHDDLQRPSLGFLLHDVARLLRKQFEQNARVLGMTRAQWQVLAYLRFYEGIRQGALAEILELEPISLSRVVDKLEAAELVERRPDPKDRRSKRLFLLPGAETVLKQLKSISETLKRDALTGVTPEEEETMLRVLQIMRANVTCGSSEERADEKSKETVKAG
ncbi:MarR family transcriptional regulator [Methyloligella sp. 2.7D]|uniref:MarR family winged helix-turn-helix transcriptional regulator n=1 Tax=unclassified Methyloligella TaxID=2625955 RepID=UPI00157BF311|nr:MarR family transcriptional regulator [Methyloligella sp. GL2]QKP76334.1 MarR family transcriptional regulator [Methyloligella sp. GL2]